jgi:chemotaxis protein MotB
VLRHLTERNAIPDSRLSAVGFGHTKPLIDPAKPGSQRVNKRVDIVVLPDVLDETRTMLEQAAREQAAQRKGIS